MNLHNLLQRACGAGALLLTSLAPIQAQSIAWTKRTTNVSAEVTMNAVTYGGGKYVVVGYRGTFLNGTNGIENQVSTSTDGATWSSATILPTNGAVRSLAYGGGLYAAPVEDTASTNLVLTSPDAVTWTARATGAGNLTSIAYGNGVVGGTSTPLWIAVGSANGGNNVARSTDGTTWTRVNTGTSVDLFQVAYGKNVFLAISRSGTLISSANGTTWTTVSIPGTPTGGEFFGLTFDGTQFLLLVSDAARNPQIFVSNDGATWAAAGTKLTSATVFDGTLAGNGTLIAMAGATSVTGNVIFTAPITSGTTPTVGSWSSAQVVDAAGFGFVFISCVNNLWFAGGYEAALYTGPSSTGSTPYTAGRFANLSVRAQAGTGESTLILGVVVNGSTGTKPLLVRAAGPSLSGYDIATYLADPSLELHQGATVLASNNDWDSASTSLNTITTSVGAFPFTAGSKDSALIYSAAPGAYTAHVTGGSGITLAELYDRNPTLLTTTPRFINASARGSVGTGANVLIAGFVVTGSTSQKVLLRAAGPALVGQGVTTALADPKLTLYRSGTLVAENDDWSSATAADQAAAGATAFTAGSKDSVLVQTLTPGIYTAIVSGVGGTTGVALVELYELP